MNEAFLQFIWKHKLFSTEQLKVDRQPVQILQVGQHNSDAGPDFFNSRIKIGETTWAGNVEIHQKASDWYRHQHETDEAYNNVILHVVRDNDEEIRNSKGELIPAMVLDYPKHLEANYQLLLKSDRWIACADRFHEADPMALQIWFHGLMIERLQQKTQNIVDRLEQNKNDWNETFYQMLARNFGFKVNDQPFEMLAHALPLQILGKHKNNLFQVEALLFGTAGLLNEQLLGDDYYLALRKEYSFLYKKYRLKSVETHIWKFLRLRPVNFPTVRLAEFAAHIHQSSALFSSLVELDDLAEIQKLFKVQASEYWDTHYRFNKASAKRKKVLGDTAFQNLMINTVVPFLFIYGEYHNQAHLKEKALDFLERIPAEKNSIISNWQKLGVDVRSAYDSQALIQLKNCYCNPKKCLNCHVGTKLINHAIKGEIS
ncbi:DUF2851 family protein [uncultured Sunxiuqinia sp.]|uniref:DUF2851 family protein n=1 Tax=uncultured Sunxiuqinia sp. TaxID=1573825 RepID=UPI002AA937D0|nr:DUF2851 family protein [uncultured Sunxiuqinia sp.]